MSAQENELVALRDIGDLHSQYGNIFKHGNRNAASHRWATYILQRAATMQHELIETLFSGFCAVSGSPVRPNDYTRYRLRIPTVTGAQAVGFMYYCCWPCVCDTQDFIRVDTLSVEAADGQRTYTVAVIGNPCRRPEKLQEPFIQPFGAYTTTLEREAAEVRCEADGSLEGATLSDHGYPIISLFFDGKISDAVGATQQELQVLDAPPQPGRMTEENGRTFQDEREYPELCRDRMLNGFNSGMGEIFRKVASISPVDFSEAKEHAAAAQGRLMAHSPREDL